MAHDESAPLVLPPLVVGPSDIVRLRREVESLDEFLRQAGLRGGGNSVQLPRQSRSLEALAQRNQLNLLQEPDRTALKQQLEHLAKHATVLHLSFAVDPSSAFTAKIITWLRENIQPNVLLQVGLQPTIAAGCVLRTPNRIFDFSLRQHFIKQKAVLIEKLESEPAA